MTERRSPRRRRLAFEILGLIGISALAAAILFLILSWTATIIAENYCFYNNVEMDEFDWLAVDRWIFSLSGLLSAGCFSLLFLAMLGDRMAYIRKLTRGIDALRMGQAESTIPLEGNNELTELADAINYMAYTQQQLREKEQALAREKDLLIRSLSHDIRTPLTSILAYSEYLAGRSDISPEEQKKHLQMIGKKAQQIRDLTELLLDGSNRNLEHFADARLLFAQLAAEFEEDLEGRFCVNGDLADCPAFAGTFDVQELRRIFDNLSSNVQKYADPAQPVSLRVSVKDGSLQILQTNDIRTPEGPQTGYQLGINSIRRIAQHYGGTVSVGRTAEKFSIAVTLSDF